MALIEWFDKKTGKWKFLKRTKPTTNIVIQSRVIYRIKETGKNE